MKKHITSLCALLLAALALSCSKSEELGATTPGSESTGYLKMSISATRNEQGDTYNPMAHLLVQLYNPEGGLLRKYTAQENLPSRMELLKGSYRVAVEAGEPAAASHTKRFYVGEQTFEVVAGQTTAAEVRCKIINTVADVKFDASIAKNFGENFEAWVVAADAVGDTPSEESATPSLRFTADGKGYFMLPDGADKLAWRFSGTHNSRGEVIKEGVLTDIKPSSKYQLTFQYSKDLPGELELFVLKVDTSTDDEDDTIIFSPDPTIKGEGFDMALTQPFIAGKWTPRTYAIKTVNVTRSVVLEFGGKSYDLLNADYTAEGIDVNIVNQTNLTVTLNEALFAPHNGGDYKLVFDIKDVKNGALVSESNYKIQGVFPPKAADCNLWTNSVTVKAMILEEGVSAILGLRKANGTWVEASVAPGADGICTHTFAPEWVEGKNEAGLTTYSPAAGTGVFAANDYEWRAAIAGVERNGTFRTAAGDAIYNAGMDYWSTYNVKGSSMTGGTVPYPNENSGTIYWVGGNNKQTSGLCTGVTIEGSNGKCAQLQPQVATGNNFAAGNLFTGTFELGTGLLDMFGFARFGHQYTYTARPSGMRFRFNAVVTQFTNTGKTGMSTSDVDYARIFVCVTNWSSRHSVKSGASFDANTFWDPEKASTLGEGAILGYGSIMIKASTNGWVTEELPIVWYDKSKAPEKGKYSLVISCVTSYKGDYMGGSQNNRLWVEDFEWIY